MESKNWNNRPNHYNFEWEDRKRPSFCCKLVRITHGILGAATWWLEFQNSSFNPKYDKFAPLFDSLRDAKWDVCKRPAR